MDPDPHPYFSFSNILLATADFLPGTGPALAGALVLLILLVLSAAFSGSETALLWLGSSEGGAANGRGGNSHRLSRLLEHSRSVLVTLLILNTLVNVAAAIIAAALAGALAIAMGWNPALTLALEVTVLALVLLVMSEASPRILAARQAPAFGRAVAGPLSVLHRGVSPLSMMLVRSADSFRDRMKRNARRISNEELKAMADAGEAHGTIREDERDLIHSIVEFGQTTAREIMVSRVDMVALPVTATMREAVDLIRTSGHSRLPLFVEHLDNIVGIVYAKDLLPYIGREDEQRLDWTRMARQPMFVPPGKKLDDLLREMQVKKTHIAIVVDEYGGTAGLVTLEDILEEIVGDIRDEHDEREPAMFEEIEPGLYRVDGRINLDDLDEVLDVDIDADQFDFETLGGLIFHLTGAIPTEGEELVHERLSLRVETVENHRIGQVLVQLLPEESDDDAVADETLSDDPE